MCEHDCIYNFVFNILEQLFSNLKIESAYDWHMLVCLFSKAAQTALEDARSQRKVQEVRLGAPVGLCQLPSGFVQWVPAPRGFSSYFSTQDQKAYQSRAPVKPLVCLQSHPASF